MVADAGPLGVVQRVGAADAETDGSAVLVGVTAADSETDGDAVSLALPVPLRDADGERESRTLPLTAAETDALRVAERVCSGDALVLAHALLDAAAFGERHARADSDAPSLALEDGVSDAAPLAVAVTRGVRETGGDAESDCDALALRESVAEALARAETEEEPLARPPLALPPALAVAKLALAVTDAE